MTDLYILCEKSSAYQNFVKALGGARGTFQGQTYRLDHSHGHLLTLCEPEKQVEDAREAAMLKSWSDMNTMPWNLAHFKWIKTYIKGDRKDVLAIKDHARDCKAFVIATDTDPSGEGDLLAWEIINAIRWSKPVYRIHFADETPASIKDALAHKVDVTDQFKQGDYLKAEARNRFDFASMQLTRIATYAARQQGYGVRVLRLGRLKSTILKAVYDQLMKVKNYVKRPYWEVRYQDANHHVYRRDYDTETSQFRFLDQTQAQHDLQQYDADTPVNIKKVKKTMAPGQLIDLSTLGSIVGRKGYNADEILRVYQLMYEQNVVSYPRTEDTKITPEQFAQLLPYVDQIAQVVHVDPKLLTHRTLRAKHMVKAAAHGANRPGTAVPASLDALATYDQQAHAKAGCAAAIYQTVALSFLSLLGEDYVYQHVTANLKNHPTFKTAFNEPVALNYKQIFDNDADRKAKKQNDNAEAHGELLATVKPYLYSGANPKPALPTQAFVNRFLIRNDLGTGATRLSTYAALTTGKQAEMKLVKGKLQLSETGLINAVLLKDTEISDVKVTQQLFQTMHDVGQFKQKPQVILQMINQIVQHDKPILMQNAHQLSQTVGAPSAKLKATPMKAKTVVHFKGHDVSIATTWGGHQFTNDELAALAAGQTIQIEGKSKAGNAFHCEGKLAQQTYNGHKFYGFKRTKWL